MWNTPGNRIVVTPPASEPFTAAEVKTQLRISTSSEDSLITRFIKAAREDMENYLCRALITQTWKVKFDYFPPNWEREIQIPFPPLVSVTHVKYYDTDGTLQTMVANTEYETLLSTDSFGRVALLPDQIWPITDPQRKDSVEIQFVCGYGASGSSIPASILNAMLLQIGNLYANRETKVIGASVDSMDDFITSLVSTYRCKRFF